jgi:hypothetical protein
MLKREQPKNNELDSKYQVPIEIDKTGLEPDMGGRNPISAT